MKSRFQSGSIGALGLLTLMAVLPLLSGCSLFETKAESLIEDVCKKYERHETLVQRISQKRLQIADEFQRDRVQANSRVATE
jgi:hypothetical protein